MRARCARSSAGRGHEAGRLVEHEVAISGAAHGHAVSEDLICFEVGAGAEFADDDAVNGDTPGEDHLFGGAAMGGTPALGACDARGAVFGVRGLHVADAASLPTATGVNPQITIVANALRMAAAIVGSA